jgi:AcrR family transcriptional regulator
MAGRGRAPSKATTALGAKAGGASKAGGAGNRTVPEPGRARVNEIQRARLLTAMTHVCAEHGVADVTVAHVVERAGVSRRTFYEIFEDREECFLAAFDRDIQRISRYVLDGYDPRANWDVRVRGALRALLSFLDQERATGRLLIVESLAAGDSALRRRRQVLDEVVAVVAEGGGETKTGKQPTPLTAEGIVGGVLSILHSRLLQDSPGTFIELAGALASMVVLPYLGPAAARKELTMPAPKAPAKPRRAERSLLSQLDMRLTYRTVRVLLAVAASPGDSNRGVADRAGVGDQGQISKLLARLEKLGLVLNETTQAGAGVPNAWVLTPQGEEVSGTLASRA